MHLNKQINQLLLLDIIVFVYVLIPLCFIL